MKIPKDVYHISEIVLLSVISIGVFGVMCWGIYNATDDKPFDPSAYLVVLTLIVGAVKERWTQRTVDSMGASLANSPPAKPPAEPK